jgi:lysophospholipid acyltransferase (LPLAT)-like uncharacterized protein
MGPGNRRSPFREWRRRRAYSLVPFLSLLVRFLVRCLGMTMRVRFEGGEPVFRMLKNGQPFFFAFFHGRQFLLIHGLRGHPVVIMTSISYLGEIQAGVLRSFGYSIVRGSSSRGGVRVLTEIIREVRRGNPCAFAVDGPRGPGSVVKPGVIFAARKLGVPVVPVTTASKPSLLFRSAWDRYQLPLPFSRGLILFGQPWNPGEGTGNVAVDQQCRELEAALKRLESRADALIRG